VLRAVSIASGIQLLVLPYPPPQGKIGLLLNWLERQYPGPLPRPRVVLRRSEP
jgi:hypothetical protein